MLGDWVSFIYIMVPLEKPYVVSYDFVTYIMVQFCCTFAICAPNDSTDKDLHLHAYVVPPYYRVRIVMLSVLFFEFVILLSVKERFSFVLKIRRPTLNRLDTFGFGQNHGHFLFFELPS